MVTKRDLKVELTEERKRVIREALGEAAERIGRRPVSTGQMALLQAGASARLVAEVYNVSRRTIYDNCLSGRFNYREAPEPVVKAAREVLFLLTGLRGA